MVQWDDRYSTGIPEVDVQHERLFRTVNELGDKIRRGEGEAHLEEMLFYLGEYAKVHFTFEEKCMEKYRCPVAAKNKASHRQFVLRYESYLERKDSEDRTALIEEIHRDAERWLEKHVATIDLHLRKCVPKKKPATPRV